MDDRILQMLPKVYFPGAVFTGTNSLYYLKTLCPEKTLMLVSETAWKIHHAKIEKHMQTKNMKIINSEPSRSDMVKLHKDMEKNEYENIVGFGGGSVLDLAKTSRMKTRHINLVLIPTTSGTGSEASRYSILVNENMEKEAIASEKLLPDVVLLDPSFSVSLPEFETVYTSLDALAHSIEGLVSKMSNPISDSLAIISIDMIINNILKIREKLEDLEIRRNLQTAGFLSGLVQSSASVGLSHSFANNLGPKLEIPHGVAISAFFVNTIKLNIGKTDKYEKLRGSLFFKDGDIVGKITDLFKKLGFYEYYKKLDLGKIDIKEAAEKIKNDVCTKTNPYNPSLEEIVNILSAVGTR